MAASTRDSQAGWNIYRSSGYTFSLEEINEKLVALGFNVVAPRTYTHYQKLHRYGYQRYIPINQLDVETLRDPVWGGPLQSRFRPRPADVDAQLLVVYDGLVVTLEGLVTQISEVDGTIRVRAGADAVPTLEDPTVIEGVQGLLLFTDDARAVVVELAQPDPDDDTSVVVSFVFLGMVSTAELAGKTDLGPSEAKLTVITNEETSPVVVLRELYSLFEAMDSARVVCDQILDFAGVADQFILPAARIVRLTIASPMNLDITLATAPLMVVAAIVAQVEYLRRKHFEADVVRGDAHIGEAQAEVLQGEAAILQERARALRIRNDQAEKRLIIDPAIVVKYALNAVAQSLPPEHRPAVLELAESELRRVSELTGKQLLPDIEHVFEAPLQSVEVETSIDIPPLVPEDDEVPASEGSDEA